MSRFLKIVGVIVVGVLLGAGQILSSGVFYLLLIYSVLGYLLWVFSKEEDKRFILILFISGLILRIFLSVFSYILTLAQYGGGGFLSGDAELYSDKGWEIAQSWLDPLKNPFPRISYGINVYTYLVAFFYYFFGHNTFIPKFINCLFGTMSGIIIYHISKHLFNIKIARLSAIFVVFSPSLIRWSIDSLKDPTLVFFLTLFFLILLKFQKKKWIYFVPLICIVLILEKLENPLYIICAIILACAFFINLRVKLLIKAGIIFLIILVFLFYSLETSNIKDRAKEYVKKIAFHQVTQAVYARSGYFIYNPAIYEGGEINIFSVILSYTKGLSYALFSPFLWRISSEPQLTSYPQILLWYFLFPFIIVGILLSLRYKIRETFPLILYIFLATSLLALAEGNVGAVFRHRDWISPFFLAFAAAGLVWVFDIRIRGKFWG